MIQGNIVLAVILFCLGITGFIIKENAIGMFLCIELMLNASNIAFLSIAQALGQAEGVVFFLLIITVAASEAGIGLALFIKIYNENQNIDINTMNLLKD